MNRLAIGTAQFGLSYGIANQSGQVTSVEAKAILETAAANGIDTLDTAIAYGDSEARLGEVGTQGFKMVTKLPAVPDHCVDVNAWVQDQVAGSLSRLNASDVYGLLLHRPLQLLEPTGKLLYEALQGLQRTGKVQKIGISIYAPLELDMLVPRYRFDLVQAPFNLLDRRIHTTGWLQRLKSEGVEIHTRSAFLQGLLLMPQALVPKKFAAWSGLWRKWHQWLSSQNISAVQASLAFTLSFPEVDRVVVGAENVGQLEQILSAARGVAPDGFPDLSCEEENLINPACWSRL